MSLQFYIEIGTTHDRQRIELHINPVNDAPGCDTYAHMIRCSDINAFDADSSDITLNAVTKADWEWFTNLLRNKSPLLIKQIVACFMKKNSWSATKLELMKL